MQNENEVFEQAKPEELDLIDIVPTIANSKIQARWLSWPSAIRRHYLKAQERLANGKHLVRRMSEGEYQAIFGEGRGTVRDVFIGGTEGVRVFSIDRTYQFTSSLRNVGLGYERIVRIPLTDELKEFLKKNLVPDHMAGGLRGIKNNPRFKWEEGDYNIVITKGRWNEFCDLISEAVKRSVS